MLQKMASGIPETMSESGSTFVSPRSPPQQHPQHTPQHPSQHHHGGDEGTGSTVATPTPLRRAASSLRLRTPRSGPANHVDVGSPASATRRVPELGNPSMPLFTTPPRQRQGTVQQLDVGSAPWAPPAGSPSPSCSKGTILSPYARHGEAVRNLRTTSPGGGAAGPAYTTAVDALAMDRRLGPAQSPSELEARRNAAARARAAHVEEMAFLHALEDASSRETLFLDRAQRSRKQEAEAASVRSGGSRLDRSLCSPDHVGFATSVLAKRQQQTPHRTDLSPSLAPPSHWSPIGGTPPHQRTLDTRSQSDDGNANNASQKAGGAGLARVGSILSSSASFRIHRRAAAKVHYATHSTPPLRPPLEEEKASIRAMAALYSFDLAPEEKMVLLAVLGFVTSSEFIPHDAEFRSRLGWYRGDMKKQLELLRSTFAEWHCVAFNRGAMWNMIHNAFCEVRKPLSWSAIPAHRAAVFGKTSIQQIHTLHDALLRDYARKSDESRRATPGTSSTRQPSTSPEQRRVSLRYPAMEADLQAFADS